MSVECPAGGCDYAGHLSAVEGHLGGVADSVHEGVVSSDLGKSLHGEGSEGDVLALLAVLVLVGALLYWSGARGEGGDDTGESEPVEGAEAGGQR